MSPLPPVTDFPLSLRRTGVRFDSGRGYVRKCRSCGDQMSRHVRFDGRKVWACRWCARQETLWLHRRVRGGKQEMDQAV